MVSSTSDLVFCFSSSYTVHTPNANEREREPRMLPRRLGRPGDATRLKYAFLSSIGRATAPTVTATTVNAFMKNNWFAAAGDALCHEVSKDHALVSKLPGVADLRPGG